MLRNMVCLIVMLSDGCIIKIFLGLRQEGLYRVNGNARVIEKLKVSFDKS